MSRDFHAPSLPLRGCPRAAQACCLLLLFVAVSAAAEVFRVATYNLEGYLDQPVGTRPAKSPEAKAKIRDNILTLKPDVLALQEMGSVSALTELRDSLRTDGLDLRFWEHLTGPDTNIHLAVLSRFPITATRPHTNEPFLLGGRRFRVSRGFCEVDIQVSTNYSFTLLTAHLKSKRTMTLADEAEVRLEEAKLLRGIIDARLAADPNANLVVAGDFNDTKDSASTKAILSRYSHKLVDTRPAERNGDPTGPDSPHELRNVAWTHYFSREDSYTRIDFILLSEGMAREWVTNQTYVLAVPDWGLASDHRPVLATFEDANK
jgi:endonuclease/exonuclease/phosphatase family metal-dependent hydrolase